MTDYYSKDETDNKITDKITEAQLNAGNVDLSNYYDKETVDEKITGVTTSLNTAVAGINEALDGKADTTAIETLAGQVASNATALGDVYDKETANSLFATTDYVDGKVQEAQGLDPEEIQGIVENYLGNTSIVTPETLAEHVTMAEETYANKETTNSALEQLNTTLANKADTANLNEVAASLGTLAETVGTLSENVANALDSKADANNVYTISVADETFVAKNDDLMTQIGTNKDAITEIEEELAGKLDNDAAILNQITTNATNIESLQNKDTELAAAIAEIPTESEVNNKINTAIAGIGLSNYLNKDEASTTYTTNEQFNTLTNTVTNDIASLQTNKLDTATAASTYLTQANASSTYATTDYVDGKVQEAQGLDPEEIQGIVENYLGNTSIVTPETLAEHVTMAEETYANKETTNSALEQLNTTLANKADTANLNEVAASLGTLAETVENVANALDGKLDNDAAILNKITANETNIATLQTDMANKLDTATAASTYLTPANASSTYATNSALETLAGTVENVADALDGKLDNDAAILNQITTNADNIASLTENKVNKTELNDYYKITDANAAFAPASLAADVASNTTALNGKVDTTAFNSFKDENTTALGNKVNNSTFETAIGTLTTNVAGKADAANVYTKAEVDSTVGTLRSEIVAAETGMDQEAVETVINNAIADKTYTKTEADSKFATLTALDQANGKITENTTNIASLTSDVETAANKANDAYTLADSAVKPSALSAYLKTADFGTALTSTTNKTAVVNAVNSSGVLTSYLTSENAMNTYATKTALNNGLATKANADDVYTKAEVDNTLNNYPTSSEVAALVTQASMCSGTVVVTSTETTVNGVRGTNFEVTCAAPKTQD